MGVFGLLDLRGTVWDFVGLSLSKEIEDLWAHVGRQPLPSCAPLRFLMLLDRVTMITFLAYVSSVNISTTTLRSARRGGFCTHKPKTKRSTWLQLSAVPADSPPKTRGLRLSGYRLMDRGLHLTLLSVNRDFGRIPASPRPTVKHTTPTKMAFPRHAAARPGGRARSRRRRCRIVFAHCTLPTNWTEQRCVHCLAAPAQPSCAHAALFTGSAHVDEQGSATFLGADCQLFGGLLGRLFGCPRRPSALRVFFTVLPHRRTLPHLDGFGRRELAGRG